MKRLNLNLESSHLENSATTNIESKSVAILHPDIGECGAD